MTIENKILSSVALLSIWFSPIIIPVIILAITTKDGFAISHKNALLAIKYQISVGILMALTFLSGTFALAQSTSMNHITFNSWILLFIAIMLGITAITICLRSIYLGIRVWVED